MARRKIPPPKVGYALLLFASAYLGSSASTGHWLHNLWPFLSAVMVFLCGYSVGRSR